MNRKRAIIVAASVFMLACVFLYPTKNERYSQGQLYETTYNRGFIAYNNGAIMLGDIVVYALCAAVAGLLAGYMGKKKA